MDKIEFKFSLENLTKEDISIFLERASPKSSTWHKSLPYYYTSVAKNYISHWKNYFYSLKNNVISSNDIDQEFFSGKLGKSATVKKCPGVLGVMTKSFIVKSPCEIYIQILDNEIASVHCSDTRLANIVSHSDFEFKTDKSSVFKNKKSIKISLPVKLKTKLPYLFLNPSYHTNSNLEVLPGVIEDPYNDYMSLIVHTLVDVSVNKDIIIKPGDPIAYMWLPKLTKLVYNNKILDNRFNQYFGKPRQKIK